MTTERTRPTMLAAEQLAADQRCTADAAAQGDHDRIAGTFRRAERHLTQQRHARVIFDRERQTETGTAPRRQIEVHRVIELLAGRKDSFRTRIHNSTKTKGQPFATGHRNTRRLGKPL